MTTKQQKIRIGLFAVVAGGLCALVLLVFGGVHFWKHRDHYHIDFKDSVSGLDEGGSVSLNGIQIGSVRSIKIAPNDIRYVRVEIEVDADAPIRTDTVAMLTMGGITGLKAIDLHAGLPSAPKLPVGGVIQVGEGTLDKVERQALAMVDQSTELMTHANELMAHATKIVDQTERIVVNLGDVTNSKELGQVMVQSRIAATNLAEASAAMRAMIVENRIQLRTSIASVDQTARSVRDLLDGPVAGITTSFGELVVQIKDTVRGNGVELKSAMADLRQASRSFKELAREVRGDPSRLLFSKSEPDRKLP